MSNGPIAFNKNNSAPKQTMWLLSSVSLAGKKMGHANNICEIVLNVNAHIDVGYE
ncbi:hypothetical protein ACJX0J_005870, partial [Zea mays]